MSSFMDGCGASWWMRGRWRMSSVMDGNGGERVDVWKVNMLSQHSFMDAGAGRQRVRVATPQRFVNSDLGDLFQSASLDRDSVYKQAR